MPRRITGVRVDTLIQGREVSVFFRSPIRYRVFEAGKDVTREFGGGLLNWDAPEFVAFHAAVDAGARSQTLEVAA